MLYLLSFLMACTLAAHSASTIVISSEAWGAVTNNVQMSVTVEGGSRNIKTNQPVSLRILIRNVGTNETFYVDVPAAIEMDPRFSFKIISPTGRNVSPKAPKIYAGSGATLTLGPGQTNELRFNLSKLFKFEEVGTYTITATKEVWTLEESRNFKVVSAPLSVSVAPGKWDGPTNRAPIRW
jgi:hypothetical protein